MLRHTRPLLALLALAVGLSSVACGGGTLTDDPQTKAETTSTTSGLNITAAISSVSLGSYQANVQLAFLATEATDSASVEVLSVALVDASDGAVVDTLTPSMPQVWNGSGYTPWDQRITPGGDLKASYELTTPKWSTVDPSGSRGGSAYSKAYKLRVTLRIDGVDVLLQSTDLHREPEVQT